MYTFLVKLGAGGTAKIQNHRFREVGESRCKINHGACAQYPNKGVKIFKTISET